MKDLGRPVRFIGKYYHIFSQVNSPKDRSCFWVFENGKIIETVRKGGKASTGRLPCCYIVTNNRERIPRLITVDNIPWLVKRCKDLSTKL